MFGNHPKYINFKSSMGNEIVVFPASLKHSEMNKMVTSVYPGYVAESAGFVDMNLKRCHGESTSLKLKSNPNIDDIYLRCQFFPE